MRQLRDRARASVQNLREELGLYEVLKGALELKYRDDTSLLLDFTRRARRSTYATVVVACYGLIEQTVDEILLAAAESISQIYSSNEDLPEKVLGNHRDLILQCLRDGDRARIRGTLSESAALRVLGAAKTEPPELLGCVFTLSTANYRWTYVLELFSRLSLKVSERIDGEEPRAALEKAEFLNIQSFLDALVQRRNDLAHSYGDENILDPDLLSTYVEIAEEILKGLISSVEEELFSRLAEMRLEPVGEVAHVWEGRIGVALSSGQLSVGGVLAVQKSSGLTTLPINSLMCEGVGGSSFNAETGAINVALRGSW